MKKTFLFLAALAMSAMTWAGETTVDIIAAAKLSASVTLNDANNPYQMGETPIKLTGTKGTSNFPAINYNATKGTDLRFYKGTTCSVTFDAGENTITKIEFLKNASTASTLGSTFSVNKGTLTDNVWEGEATSVTLTYNHTENYKEQMYIINITYSSSTPQRTLQSIYIDGTATKLEYFVGESFDPAGLKVMGKYDSGEDTEITKGIEWLFDPEVFALGDETVDVLASVEAFSSEVFTVNNIVVKEKVIPTGYASIYTSNVVLTAGANSSDADIIYGGETYDGVKCGTSSKAGSCTTTISAATKMLHFHAIGWKGAASTTLTVNGAEYTITPDDGITSNPPFTLVGDAYEYYYTFDPKGATEITFTSDKRFVVFGVNAELQEGVVAAPSFEPTNGDFDQEVNVTLTAEEGAEIFYAINEAVTAENAIKYTEPIELIETTTIYAIAKKDGKESAQANKTYNLIPAYTVEEIAALTPAGQKAVLVLKDDEIVDIYAGKSGDISGLYFQATDKKIELYNQNYAFPNTWEKGGKVTGRVMGEWVDFNGTWELKIATEEIGKLEYTAPQPTGINNVKANAKATKAIVNGQFIIIRDNVRYNVAGQQL